MTKIFFGFPGRPTELVDNIDAGIQRYRELDARSQIIPWSEIDGPSTPIIGDILRSIEEAESAFFDITFPNTNVFYEVGFALGEGKPIYLTINDAMKDAMRRQIALGIFDTQRLKRYRGGHDLANIIRDSREPYQQSTFSVPIDYRQPLFFQHHLAKIEFATSYFSCVKQQKLGLRQYDPQEDNRLPLDRAYREIAASTGAFLSLLPNTINGSEEHNLRAFLLAGLAEALQVPYILLKYGEFTVDFDLRDRVIPARSRNEINDAVVALLPLIHERTQGSWRPRRALSRSHLVNISLGASAAENERTQLEDYFLETREFRRALQAESRLVIGRKGAGKTAIFWQVRDRLRSNRNNLVLDLRPEGFQLRKLSEVISEHFSKATHAHTMTVFWEYVLYLELAHKILSDDQTVYSRDPRLTARYGAIRDARTRT
jgi:hypothetical protein